MTHHSRPAPSRPAPGRAAAGPRCCSPRRGSRRLLALRNGEQVLLTLLIPLALLIGLTLLTIVPMPGAAGGLR